MDYTQNFHLPQFEETDRIHHDDFNDAFAAIDAAITNSSYAVGSYTGNGKTEAEGGTVISLGFHPRFLIIAGDWAERSTGIELLYFGFGADPRGDIYVRLTDDGFQVMKAAGSNGAEFHFLNQPDYIYSYIAFR